MIIMTSAAATSGLPPVVSDSRQGLAQLVDKISITKGRELPLEGKAAPHPRQSIQVDSLLASVETINTFVQSLQRDLSINLDADSGRTVIKVIDRDSGNTIRQIPSEEALSMAKQIAVLRDGVSDTREATTGLLFSGSV